MGAWTLCPTTNRETRPPVIDLHCHAAGIGAGGSGCIASPHLRSGPLAAFFYRGYGVSYAEVAQLGDAILVERVSKGVAASAEVDEAVVLALDAVVDPQGREDAGRTQLYVPNDFLAAEVSRYGNLHFGGSVHPNRRDALERLERIAREGAVLVKWLPPVQEIDPADRRHIPYYEKMVELGLPLLAHTGAEYVFRRPRPELTDPARLRLPLEVGVSVIAAHAGSGGSTEGIANSQRLFSLMEEFSTLYTDVSALTLLSRWGGLRRLLADPTRHPRILYGSDFTNIEPAVPMDH